MSSQPDTPPLPSDLVELQSLIAQLIDDRALQQTICASLAGPPQDPDLQSQLNEARTELDNIKNHLTAARKAEYNGIVTSRHMCIDHFANISSLTAAQKSAGRSSHNVQQSQNRANGRAFATGNSDSHRPCQPWCPTLSHPDIPGHGRLVFRRS